MNSLLQSIKNFLKAETVLSIAAAAAFVTMFLVPPSTNYISYLDFRVLSLLFCLMAVVSGFQKTGIFLLLSERLLARVKTLRSLSMILILLCFFTSMLITNDVALITFVPFGIMLLHMTGQNRQLIRVVVLQTIAANLGSMLTPLGNPQNLYLYTRFELPLLTFLSITLPFTVVSLLLLCLASLRMKKEPLSLPPTGNQTLYQTQSRLLPVYTGLFLVCIGCVLRFFDYRLMLAVVILTVLIFDRPIFKRVDYTLLLTFVCFFIFVGNIGNLSPVKNFLSILLEKRELAASIAVSQIISNVPAAVLLSAFTNNYKSLILGTDLGGLGTLVASLASLISYKLYCRTTDAQKGKYLLVFTLYNLIFLAGLCLFYLVTS